MECWHAPKRPAFADDDEERSSKSAERSGTATGRKPKAAINDPFFQLVWKQAGKELRRYIFFTNAFPDSATYDSLPLKVYAIAVRAVSKTGCYDKELSREEGRKEFNIDWSSGVSCRWPWQTNNWYVSSWLITWVWCVLHSRALQLPRYATTSRT